MPMGSPVIGISAALERARWGVWEETVALAPRSYATAVQRAGGTAVLLPPDAAAEAEPDRMIDALDALILAGGSDVDAASYGADPHAETSGTWPERDSFELALARRALARDLPLLGICRGMQILNVARGGTLCQHVPELVGHERHREVPGTFGGHEVRLEPGSLAAEAAGAERIGVKSHHHQGVDEVGEGLVVSGHSVDDDLIEAIELPDRRFALGVIWHPEEDVDDRVIGSLVAAARTGCRNSFDQVKGITTS
ncbi:MAG TPA: gamma-glutamyl-gamma-aminobutyrate hydrolase family protein [Solirubrobacterales bacterium]